MTGPIPESKLREFQRKRKHAALSAGPLPLPGLAHVFFQRQLPGSATCGLHALNNALGQDVFSAPDLLFALENFLAENPELGDKPADHVQEPRKGVIKVTPKKQNIVKDIGSS